jgi:hypothetical protein
MQKELAEAGDQGFDFVWLIVDIDPREGSGVIPNDWEAFLQPKGRPEAAVRGRTGIVTACLHGTKCAESWFHSQLGT